MKERRDRERTGEARQLMEAFAHRTGLRNAEGDPGERYLWTDAFAVQTFFGLSHIYQDDSYRNDAFTLIDLVHKVLGSYHAKDSRTGWISGLPAEKGEQHPTAGGLRIGKNLPERPKEEAFNEELEWDRDGQYFHYITRWTQTLLCAGRESGDERYAEWASDLLQAGAKFIYPTAAGFRMYWKMSTDLSRPLVTGMGAQDPLEGLICALSIIEAVPHKSRELEPIVKKFSKLCTNQNWKTPDPLGIGGLLLNTARSFKLNQQESLPENSKPEALFKQSTSSLQNYHSSGKINYSASRRLAFRECGLSLGLRTMAGRLESLPGDGIDPYLDLAGEVEEFWCLPVNREVPSWKNHLNINAVSLAASLVAKEYPHVF